jgi:hypothetical protein
MPPDMPKLGHRTDESVPSPREPGGPGYQAIAVARATGVGQDVVPLSGTVVFKAPARHRDRSPCRAGALMLMADLIQRCGALPDFGSLPSAGLGSAGFGRGFGCPPFAMAGLLCWEKGFARR